MADQPEALRLADWVETNPAIRQEPAAAVASELRRLSAVNQELLEVLRRIATVNAMDYEYRAWARAAIAKAEAQP